MIDSLNDKNEVILRMHLMLKQNAYSANTLSHESFSCTRWSSLLRCIQGYDKASTHQGRHARFMPSDCIVQHLEYKWCIVQHLKYTIATFCYKSS